jgi:nitrogen fixation/metabolism regulation signal transduction histidine kinase
MLNEVRSSVEKLAETERETAWREMAKQVAHEIKNPLTPMKLRVQHLQRTWSADDKDFKEKLNAFADAMTEQIDTLSNIATEFSNFAKMPKASQDVVAVDDALAGCVELFSTAEGVSVVFENKCTLKPRINADKEEVLRVFNNLIKNAIQAIPEGRDGLVKCVVSGNQHEVVIEVCDNGAGIPAEAREKIFQPNFTTKSQGTGLGLAMVKNIVNLANGSISYTTSPEGTCFTLVFPAYSSNAG